ncbi:MAG: hypothetical protein QE280_11135 [Caulobacter sp.]|nr:hypothetical protein [Caulobacter sp.]
MPTPIPPSAPKAQAPPPASSKPDAGYGYGYGSGSARSYSVAREFGGTPDRILAPLPQSAYKGRAEVALSPDILTGQPGADAEPAENEPVQDPRPVRPAPKDKR